MENIAKKIFELENKLLKNEVRTSPENINELLANDFTEFCSSGHKYQYKKGDIFESDIKRNETNFEIKDFEIKHLSDNCILAVYKLIKHDEVNENKKFSLRSSIWKKLNGSWRMFFHQGTLTSKL